MAMAIAEAEHDEAARVDAALQAAARTVLGYLANVRFENRWDRQDVEHYAKLPALDAAQLKRVTAMSWTYRRQLPRHIAPKLPPHDPIVQEMERAHAG